MNYDGLDYQWVARLADGSEKSQFDENGENEVLFKEVKDLDIATFILENTKTHNRGFAVDLKTGKFRAFGKWISVGEGNDDVYSNREDLKFRLIYFRQVTRVFQGLSGPQLKHSIEFCIGWQATDIMTGKNIKKMIKVADSENITFV